MESASGLKIVVTTDLGTKDIQLQLWNIYSVFADLVVQNPNWGVNDVIEMDEFTKAVDKILLSSVSNKNSKIQIPAIQSFLTLPIEQDSCYTLASQGYIPTSKETKQKIQWQQRYLHNIRSQKPRRNCLQQYQ